MARIRNVHPADMVAHFVGAQVARLRPQPRT